MYTDLFLKYYLVYSEIKNTKYSCKNTCIMLDIVIYVFNIYNRLTLTPNLAWHRGIGKTFLKFTLKLIVFPLTIGLTGSFSVG